MSEVDVMEILRTMKPQILDNPFYKYKNLHLNRLVKGVPYEMLWSCGDNNRSAFITLDSVTVFRILLPKSVFIDLTHRLSSRKTMQDKIGLLVTKDPAYKYGRMEWVQLFKC